MGSGHTFVRIMVSERWRTAGDSGEGDGGGGGEDSAAESGSRASVRNLDSSVIPFQCAAVVLRWYARAAAHLGRSGRCSARC